MLDSIRESEPNSLFERLYVHGTGRVKTRGRNSCGKLMKTEERLLDIYMDPKGKQKSVFVYCVIVIEYDIDIRSRETELLPNSVTILRGAQIRG